MKYFIDTEFIEGFKKPLFGKKRHFIDLISIGIVCEDGRSYYAISNEYNYNDASDWVKENIIIPMYTQEISGDKRNHIDAEHFHKCIPNGKSNKQIANEIKEFCKSGVVGINEKARNNVWDGGQLITRSEPVFYGYYADYDWVLLCSLFGRMIDLPNGFPMYCIDLKQEFDHDYDVEIRERMKQREDYPKQKNEHNALDDARWNFELYKWLEYTSN